jgi:hypothetical protein
MKKSPGAPDASTTGVYSCNDTNLMPAGGGAPETRRACIIWLKLGFFCSAACTYAVSD